MAELERYGGGWGRPEDDPALQWSPGPGYNDADDRVVEGDEEERPDDHGSALPSDQSETLGTSDAWVDLEYPGTPWLTPFDEPSPISPASGTAAYEPGPPPLDPPASRHMGGWA